MWIFPCIIHNVFDWVPQFPATIERLALEVDLLFEHDMLHCTVALQVQLHTIVTEMRQLPQSYRRLLHRVNLCCQLATKCLNPQSRSAIITFINSL